MTDEKVPAWSPGGALARQRRSRTPGRRWLCLAHRPGQGHNHSRRAQHRPAGDRGGAVPASRRRGRRRRGPAGQLCRRNPRRIRSAQAGSPGRARKNCRHFARERIPERAAAPAEVIILAEMPLTRRRQDLQAGIALYRGAAHPRARRCALGRRKHRRVGGGRPASEPWHPCPDRARRPRLGDRSGADPRRPQGLPAQARGDGASGGRSGPMTRRGSLRSPPLRGGPDAPASPP